MRPADQQKTASVGTSVELEARLKKFDTRLKDLEDWQSTEQHKKKTSGPDDVFTMCKNLDKAMRAMEKQ